ncbi:beta strand repeat-containing protein [Agrobacterium vitis]|uniref:beta strand repeat-containing protein n=1 Tax=Agrobacterium vitis TaxID=373 RepID=UPI003D2AAE08
MVYILGGSGNDTITGTSGYDSLYGGLGDDTINGGADYDTLSGDEGNDVISGEDGSDFMMGGSGNDSLSGDAGDDNLYGEDGNDSLFGSAGDDDLNGEAGADILNGGDGTDTVNYWSSDAININLATGVASGSDAQGDTFVSIEVISASNQDDVLVGDDNDNIFKGGYGSDTIHGGDGDDTLAGGWDADVINGGNGSDTASFFDNMAVVVNLKTGEMSGDAQGDVLIDIENLMGSYYDDTLTGDDGDNVIDGYYGWDLLDGGLGADTLKGGEGGGGGAAVYTYSNEAVQINIDTGINTGGYAEGDVFDRILQVYGSAFNDTFTASKDARFAGGLGDDHYIVNNSSIYLIEQEGEGIDTVTTGLNSYDLSENFENLTYTGTANFTGSGTVADNVMISGAGADYLFGNNGNDTLIGGAGADKLSGGGDNDTSSYRDSTSAVTVNLTTGLAQGGFAQGDTFISIESLEGSAYNDTLTGDREDNTLRGGDGGDVLDGAAGSDTASYLDSTSAVTVNLQTRTLSGGYANGDTIISIENLEGSAYADSLTGDDEANVLTGGTGADLLDGGAGSDTANYSDSTAGVIVNLVTGQTAGGSAEGDVLVSIENITGSSESDYLTGNDGSNVLSGGEGDDHLIGGSGDDLLNAGSGTDILDGGDGNDTASYADSSVGISASLSGDTGVGGSAEGDVLISIETLEGSVYADTLSGSGYADVLKGGEDADTLFGLDGNDSLHGDGGDDVLYADAGDDTLAGGEGDDALYGGEGSDVFVFNSNYDNDVIFDFDSSADSIDLTSMGFATVSDAAAYATEIEGGVLFTFSHVDTLTVYGLNYASLTSSDALM